MYGLRERATSCRLLRWFMNNWRALLIPRVGRMDCAIVLVLAFCSAGANAQQVATNTRQALSWDQVKAKFEAANPALKADQNNVEELKAQEITAYLRPNPQFTLSQDGTQIAPHEGVWRPTSGTQVQPNVSYLHERDHKRELRLEAAKDATKIGGSQHEDLERNMIFSLRSAFVQTLQAKAVLELALADIEYYDKIIEISRVRFKDGSIAQVDLDRIELLRVQYESEIETATVNLRTQKIHMLQLLDDRTPIDQFDVTGPFDFSDSLKIGRAHV